MRISAKVDYAVRALAELASADEPMKGDMIASRQQIPLKFLENILSELRRAGIVGSRRGYLGGYWLVLPADSITMADVIRTVEGPLAHVSGKALEDRDYPGAAKGLRDVWIATRASLRIVLEQVTIADVAAGKLPTAVHRLTEPRGPCPTAGP